MNVLPKLSGFCLPARVLGLFADDIDLELTPQRIYSVLNANRRTVSDVLSDHVRAGRLARIGTRGLYRYALPKPNENPMPTGIPTQVDRANAPAVRAM